MNLEIFPVYNELDEYIADMEIGKDAPAALWEKYAIAPFWPTLTRYAPMDLSGRKPSPVADISSLKKQLFLLKQIDLTKLKNELNRVASALPSYDDDPVTVAIYPLPDENIAAKERQNGVVGTSLWGNMTICVSPLADDYKSWIPYVFAHEYHHSIFGNYWFGQQVGELENTLLDSLLIDGEADSFALSLYPALRPRWLFDMTEETERSLWREHYSNAIFDQDFDYDKLMFGDESGGIPWCAGYAIGHRIVRQYLAKNPATDVSRLHEIHPREIFGKSGYDPT